MRAAVIREHGELDRVLVEDVANPEPGPGEARIRVHAAGLNHLDLWVLRGRPGMGLTFPHILGSDAAGVIDRLGPGTQGWSEGDDVVINPSLSCDCCEACRRGEQSECATFGIVGLSRPGTFAEMAVVPARCLFPKPRHLDFKQAAALPLAYMTAWRMLMTRAKLRPGETVLIHGVGGGVALAALQLAKLAGAQVIATTSTEEKMRCAKALGADGLIHYRREDVAARVRELTGGRGVDIAFDNVGAATWALDFACLRKGGRLVLCGVTSGPTAETDLRALYWNQWSIMGSTMGSDEDMRLMLAAVNAAKLVPVVCAAEPLVRVGEALFRLQRGRQMGKVVLRIR